MADHVWSVFCYKGCIDRFTNQISLLDVIEELMLAPNQLLSNAPPGSAFRIPCDIATLWLRSNLSTPERRRMRIRLVAPNGISSDTSQGVIDVDLEATERCRTLLKMEGLPFWGEGLYRFIVELEGNKPDEWYQCAAIPLMVKIGDPAPVLASVAAELPKPVAKKKRSRR
jgi:hypothetical protein